MNTQKGIWNPLPGFLRETQFWATFLIAIVLVAIKKWEPGDNLDAIWYSAVSKNVYETGDFNHFFLSRHWHTTVSDHMPLTYWITGAVFMLFGPSDFVARLYPIICGILSYLFVYFIGREIKGRHFGLCSILALALAYGFSKWNGSLMQDVPLVTYFLGTAYFFIAGLRKPKMFLAAAPFFVAGVMTKGPIIGAIPLAIFIWSLWQRDFSFLKKPAFYGGVALTFVLFAIFLHPVFHIDGRDPFTFFYFAKKGYAESTSENFWRYFAYVEVLWTNAAPLFLLSLYAFWGVFGSKFQLSAEERSKVRLCGLIALCTIIPLSFFRIKFPHYMLPAYPFLALVAAVPLSQWLLRFEERLPIWLQRLAIVAVFVLAVFPIQTSGGRTKEVLNIVNVVKLDPKIREKRVVFLGGYEDDMAIFQSFKWYGSIDLAQITGDQLGGFDFKNGYMIVKRSDLPLAVGDAVYDENACFLRNWQYCVLTDRAGIMLELPVRLHPHQVY